jgi:GT2 family glycosyltransferase
MELLNESIRLEKNYFQNKDIAIIIPCRDRGDLLRRCLVSIREQDISLENLEILVCDDGSKENISEVVGSFEKHFSGIRLIRQHPRGPAAARNMGICASKAEIIICIDSDVICSNNFLRGIVKALDSNPEWVAVEGTVVPIDGENSPLWDAPVNKGGVYLSAASAYRSEALHQVGGFDENFIYAACEDTDLAARLLRIGNYGYAAEAVVYHPRRRVTIRSHWSWRMHWKYIMILAKRYGFLGFPGHPVGQFPRLRVSLSALIRIPMKRIILSLKYARKRPFHGLLGFVYGLFDILCGFVALPHVLFSPIPPFRDYLGKYMKQC